MKIFRIDKKKVMDFKNITFLDLDKCRYFFKYIGEKKIFRKNIWMFPN